MCYAGEPTVTYNPETGTRAREEYVNMGRYSGHKPGTAEWDKQAAINKRVVKEMNYKRMHGGRRSSPAPGQKTAAPEYEAEHPSKVQGKPGYQDEGQRKKALEVRKKKEGVKEFAPIDEKTMPELPDSGISAP